MSHKNEVPSTTSNATSTAAPADLLAIWELIRNNFAVVSGLAVIVGIGFAILFLSSYLSVFDWHLLWFIQYPDIISFGLVAVGVIGGSLLTLYFTVLNFLHTGIHTGKLQWGWVIALIVVYLFILGSQIYSEHSQPEPHYWPIFLLWFAGLAAISGVVMFIQS
jgi:hypothetical protein